MCNSYEQQVTYAQYRDAIRAAELQTPEGETEANLPQSDNIRIGDMGPVLRPAGNGVELILMRFGWPAPTLQGAARLQFPLGQPPLR